MAARQRGIALIMVLWLTMLLTVIGSAFAFSMRSEALAARNALSVAQARAAANGAIDRTAYEISLPPTPESWSLNGASHAFTDGDIAIVASAADESSRIDLNVASDRLLRGLLTTVGGADPDQAGRITDAILDWRDADDLRRPNGAEEPDYRAAGRKYRPANGNFETVTELARVLGVTPEIYEKIAGSLTVLSRQAGINTATASRSVLLALPNATPELVDAFIEQRTQARTAKLPVPPFPLAQGFAAGSTGVWRIRAEATMPDGVTFAREAVVRMSGDPRRPIVPLAWIDAASSPLPATAAMGAAAPRS